MIFKVKWGDLRKEFSKKVMLTANPGEETPLKFYFEDEEKILDFLVKGSAKIYSEIIKDENLDLEELKMGSLSDAVELMENPLTKQLSALVAQY